MYSGVIYPDLRGLDNGSAWRSSQRDFVNLAHHLKPLISYFGGFNCVTVWETLLWPFDSNRLCNHPSSPSEHRRNSPVRRSASEIPDSLMYVKRQSPFNFQTTSAQLDHGSFRCMTNIHSTEFLAFVRASSRGCTCRNSDSTFCSWLVHISATMKSRTIVNIS